MNIITIPNIKQHFSELINSSLRQVRLVYCDKDRIDILYAISHIRTYREGVGPRKALAMIIKLLCPVPVITGLDSLMEDTKCFLTLKVHSIHNNCVNFTYEISVANGSELHKRKVKKIEEVVFRNKTYMPRGFSKTDNFITLNLKKSNLVPINSTTEIKKISFKGDECSLCY